MIIVIGDKIYDSTKQAVLVVFDENEREHFKMKRYVSAPPDSTEEERQRLIDMEIE